MSQHCHRTYDSPNEVEASKVPAIDAQADVWRSKGVYDQLLAAGCTPVIGTP